MKALLVGFKMQLRESQVHSLAPTAVTIPVQPTYSHATLLL